MAKVYIRRSKRNPDTWQVMNGQTIVANRRTKTGARKKAAKVRREKKK